jgi:hypothetical protein
VRVALLCLLLFASCGGASKPPAPGRPEEVAKAVFEALKAGEIGPIEPHMMTAAEAKSLTGVVLDDTAQRDHWRDRFAQLNERLNVDWETAVPGAPKVKYDSMGRGAVVTQPITSSKGTVTMVVSVTKVGRRFVFQELKAAPGAETKQAAPGSEEDGG